MNRADVDRIVSEAHEAGVRANLNDADLPVFARYRT